jgi:hypothetical protein
VIRITVIGGGNVGHALGSLLGSRPEFCVSLWARRLRRPLRLALRAFGSGGTYALGVVWAEPSLDKAVDGADVVVLAIPAHVRHQVLTRIAGLLRNCTLLLAWEGMGRFTESLCELGISGPVPVGLQRSPLICRTRQLWRSVEILGVRSQVVAATPDPADRPCAKSLLNAIFPFCFLFAPSYTCVALSPGNPLIHAARIYSFGRSRKAKQAFARFYADWDDDASTTLLVLHGELANLRDALGIPARFVSTLTDGVAPPSALEVTRDIRSEHRLAEVMVPGRIGSNGVELDQTHRFLREDIGEGLSYILSIAEKNGVEMPMAKAIHRWYLGHIRP